MLKYLSYLAFLLPLLVKAEKPLDLKSQLGDWHAQINTSPSQLLNRLKVIAINLDVYDTESIELFHTLYCQTSIRLEHYPDALSTAEDALTQSRTPLSTQAKAKLLLCRADAHQFLGHTELAEKDYEQALSYSNAIKDTETYVATLLKVGEFHAYQSRFSKAQVYLQEAFKISQGFDNEDVKYSVDSSLGSFYAYKKEYEKALPFYERVKERELKRGYKQQASVTLFNLGIIAYRLAQFEQAISYFEQSKALAQVVHDDAGIAYADSGIADAYIQQSRFDEARVPLMSAKRFFEKSNNVSKVADSMLSEARLFSQQGEYEKSIALLIKAKAIFEKEKASEKIRLLLERLYLNYLQLEQYQNAINALDAHHVIEHQLNEEEQAIAAQRMLAEFQFELQEAENNQLKQNLASEQEKVKQQASMQTLQLSLIAIVLCFTLLIVFHLYKQFQYGKKMKLLAMYDELTKIPNRRAIMGSLKKAISWSLRYQNDLTIAIIDIDHFKAFNDNYGHDTGDKVLENFSELIIKLIRSTDHFGRIGGEEFLLIMPNTSTEQATVLLERLLAATVNQKIMVKGQELSISISAGITQFEAKKDTLMDIYNRADVGLYKAKNAGRNQYAIS